MKYKRVIKAKLVKRENRFVASVDIDGVVFLAHVKNTGRCKELLVPGCVVYLNCADSEKRSTSYDLIAIEKVTDRGVILINIDSQIPNDAVAEWLPHSRLISFYAKIRREYTYGESRFDFYIEDRERRIFIEVKGVTLENNGIVMFPDAPTERGAKHLRGLIEAKKKGFECYVIFVIQLRGAKCFLPNYKTDSVFSKTLVDAVKHGVKALAYDCIVAPDTISIGDEIELDLGEKL